MLYRCHIDHGNYQWHARRCSTDIVQAIIMLFGFATLAIVKVTKYNVLFGVRCTDQRENPLDAHTYTNCFTREFEEEEKLMRTCCSSSGFLRVYLTCWL